MTNISIDLLPYEFRSEELKRARFVKVQTVGVAVILLIIFLSSLTVALGILQSQNLAGIQNRVAKAEQKISDLKDTQTSLLLLKNRLAFINKYLGVSSKQLQIYKLVDNLLPKDLNVSSLSVDESGQVLVLATAPDGDSLNQLFDNLLSKDRNNDKISQVSVDTLNRGRDGVYRISFKVKTKI